MTPAHHFRWMLRSGVSEFVMTVADLKVYRAQGVETANVALVLVAKEVVWLTKCADLAAIDVGFGYAV